MRFRFTIRDLLWLTLVVALAVGWWLDHKPPPKPRYEVIEYVTPHSDGDVLIDHVNNEMRALGHRIPMTEPKN